MTRRLIVAAAAAMVLSTPFSLPVPIRAESVPACAAWTAEMVEDEGGQVLMAQACATDRPESYITLTCGGSTVGIRVDLAAGSETLPEPNETADVTFASSTDKVTLQMGYEEYDGYFGAYPSPSDPVIHLMKAGDALAVGDVPGKYAPLHFSLSGSSTAIGRLLADCD